MPEIVRDLDAAGVLLDDLSVRRPSLDDVFLILTGHAAGRGPGGSAGRAGDDAAGEARTQPDNVKELASRRGAAPQRRFAGERGAQRDHDVRALDRCHR
jgi:ABC-2 type transport system ATP-binding protein